MGRRTLLILTVMAGHGSAQVVSYDGTSFPEEAADPWVRLDFINLAERWLENGWLVQAPVLLPCPPDCTTQDFYERDLESSTGESTWVLTWRMVTNGPEAFSANAPAGIATGATSGAFYHFTIARDRVRFLRGTQFPIVFADFDPGPHVFRLELRGSASYSFTIDGKLVDAGVPEAVYPTEDSVIVFGARAAIEDSITRWDYIKFGFLATGDMDEDGDVDVVDFEMFQSCIAEGGPQTNAGTDCWGADMDQDGGVDFHDFAPFQRAFTGPK